MLYRSGIDIGGYIYIYVFLHAWISLRRIKEGWTLSKDPKGVLIRVDSLVPAYSTFSLAHKECSFMFISFESIFKEAWSRGFGTQGDSLFRMVTSSWSREVRTKAEVESEREQRSEGEGERWKNWLKLILAILLPCCLAAFLLVALLPYCLTAYCLTAYVIHLKTRHLHRPQTVQRHFSWNSSL